MSPIKDIDKYNSSMTKAMEDKLEFWSYIDYDVLVDFGCADGSLIKALDGINEPRTYVAYDMSQDMLNLAEHKLRESESLIHFTTEWSKVGEVLKTVGKNQVSILVLSSLIHEVYNYCNGTEINQFWNKVFNSGFDYIIIRDMMVSEDSKRTEIDELIENKHYLWRSKLLSTTFGKMQYESYKEIYGPIRRHIDIVHLLMKEGFTENWERELNENYFMYSTDRLLERVGKSGYNLEYFHHYTLPHLKNKSKDIFQYNIPIRTHVKCILKIKQNES